MRFGLEILGREVLAVTVGVGDSGEDPDADHLDDGPAYELGSDSTPADVAEWREDDEDAPRPLVIVRGDHLRDRTTRVRRNRPPFIGSGPTRGDVRNAVKPSTAGGFGFQI